MFGTEYTADSWACQRHDIRYREVAAGVRDAHSDHLHTTVYVDHFSFADLDEVILKREKCLNLPNASLHSCPCGFPMEPRIVGSMWLCWAQSCHCIMLLPMSVFHQDRCTSSPESPPRSEPQPPRATFKLLLSIVTCSQLSHSALCLHPCSSSTARDNTLLQRATPQGHRAYQLLTRIAL